MCTPKDFLSSLSFTKEGNQRGERYHLFTLRMHDELFTFFEQRHQRWTRPF